MICQNLAAARGPPPAYVPPMDRRYGTPQPGYGPTQPGYGPPKPGYGPPQPGYGPPQPGYGPVHPGYGGQPVVGSQPGSAVAEWMAKPEATSNCPPGLEYLTQVDQILVEAFTNWKTENHYQIKNTLGQQVYYAFEESDPFQRQCCGKSRGFIIHIVDNTNQEVMRISREFKCCAGWCCCADSDCCGLEVVVEAPVGQVIGYVRQVGSAWGPSCEIMDPNRTCILKIFGPCCIWGAICCSWDQEFKVYNPNGIEEVGKVAKQWSGLVKQLNANAVNFGVEFPMDLDVKVKATMIGAVFLIDFMFFVQQRKQQPPLLKRNGQQCVQASHRI